MFDFIGDVHGCAEELDELLIKLGYLWDSDTGIFTHPLGTIPVFVGDLVDRGPDSASVLSLSMNMAAEKRALFVLGNHEDKLLRTLQGRKTKVGNALAETIKQIESRGNSFVNRVMTFLSAMPWKLKLHDSRVLVCHAGLAEKYHDRDDDAARSKCLYGDTTGEKDSNGYPVRLDWADHYKGPNLVIHGHVPVAEPFIKNNVYNIDTGCCFGGKLTALRYPSMEMVSVNAYEEYYERIGGLN